MIDQHVPFEVYVILFNVVIKIWVLSRDTAKVKIRDII
jgi:hypothetical protein